MAALVLAVAAYASTPVDLPDAPSPGAGTTPAQMLQSPPAAPEARPPLQGPTPRYHWRGLLLQSLEFNLIENGFRLATDDTMRFQIAHKPYWHDYFASTKQFNMGRWKDGDNFLV